MEHIRVANYRLATGATFHEVADLGGGELISISLWESAEAAEHGVALAREWVAEHLAGRIDLVSNKVGEVAFTAS